MPPVAVTPRKFRRAPVITEAVQWDGSTGHANAIIRWMNEDPERGDVPEADSEYWLEHREGGVNVMGLRSFGITTFASEGNWIVRATAGVYSASPDAFFRTLNTEVEERPAAPGPRTVWEVAVNLGDALAVALVLAVFAVGMWAVYRSDVTWESAVALTASMLLNWVLLGLVITHSVHTLKAKAKTGR